MALSITCSCGAKLEIDDKFAGKIVNCPDCHKELTTSPAPPKVQRTSALAIASLMTALVGALTVLASLAAIVCGFLSLRQQAKHPELAGRNLARAGIALGGLFFLVS